MRGKIYGIMFIVMSIFFASLYYLMKKDMKNKAAKRQETQVKESPTAQKRPDKKITVIDDDDNDVDPSYGSEFSKAIKSIAPLAADCRAREDEMIALHKNLKQFSESFVIEQLRAYYQMNFNHLRSVVDQQLLGQKDKVLIGQYLELQRPQLQCSFYLTFGQLLEEFRISKGTFSAYHMEQIEELLLLNIKQDLSNKLSYQKVYTIGLTIKEFYLFNNGDPSLIKSLSEMLNRYSEQYDREKENKAASAHTADELDSLIRSLQYEYSLGDDFREELNGIVESL